MSGTQKKLIHPNNYSSIFEELPETITKKLNYIIYKLIAGIYAESKIYHPIFTVPSKKKENNNLSKAAFRNN